MAMCHDSDDTWTVDAMQRGDVAAVMKRAQEDPAYLASRDFVGATPLLTAIDFGDAHLVELMLRRGADPNVEVDDGYTALLTAIESERSASVQIVSQLIAAGADIHRTGANGWTPLHMAAAYGRLEKARLLIDAGARVNERIPIDEGQTPLMEAASQGRSEMARLLLDRGADPSMRDTFLGRTSLEIARDAVKREAADRPTPDGDYEGVIRVLSAFDDD
jgi:ankyrin repeat protein